MSGQPTYMDAAYCVQPSEIVTGFFTLLEPTQEFGEVTWQ